MPYSLYRRGVRASGRRRSGGGPPLFVAATSAGGGATTTTSSLSITVPASAASGQVGLIFVSADLNPTLTTPSGWSLLRTDDAGTNARSWIFTKDMVNGDASAATSLSFGTANRPTASMLLFSGVTRTGLLSNVLTNTTAASNGPLPTLAGTTAGGLVIAAACRRRSGPAATITFPSPYTNPTGSDAGTAFGTGANTSVDEGYNLNGAGGTVGGESTTTTGGTSIGNNYVLFLPVG